MPTNPEQSLASATPGEHKDVPDVVKGLKEPATREETVEYLAGLFLRLDQEKDRLEKRAEHLQKEFEAVLALWDELSAVVGKIDEGNALKRKSRMKELETKLKRYLRKVEEIEVKLTEVKGQLEKEKEIAAAEHLVGQYDSTAGIFTFADGKIFNLVMEDGEKPEVTFAWENRGEENECVVADFKYQDADFKFNYYSKTGDVNLNYHYGGTTGGGGAGNGVEGLRQALGKYKNSWALTRREARKAAERLGDEERERYRMEIEGLYPGWDVVQDGARKRTSLLEGLEKEFGEKIDAVAKKVDGKNREEFLTAFDSTDFPIRYQDVPKPLLLALVAAWFDKKVNEDVVPEEPVAGEPPETPRDERAEWRKDMVQGMEDELKSTKLYEHFELSGEASWYLQEFRKSVGNLLDQGKSEMDVRDLLAERVAMVEDLWDKLVDNAGYKKLRALFKDRDIDFKPHSHVLDCFLPLDQPPKFTGEAAVAEVNRVLKEHLDLLPKDQLVAEIMEELSRETPNVLQCISVTSDPDGQLRDLKQSIEDLFNLGKTRREVLAIARAREQEIAAAMKEFYSADTEVGKLLVELLALQPDFNSYDLLAGNFLPVDRVLPLSTPDFIEWSKGYLQKRIAAIKEAAQKAGSPATAGAEPAEPTPAPAVADVRPALSEAEILDQKKLERERPAREALDKQRYELAKTWLEYESAGIWQKLKRLAPDNPENAGLVVAKDGYYGKLIELMKVADTEVWDFETLLHSEFVNFCQILDRLNEQNGRKFAKQIEKIKREMTAFIAANEAELEQAYKLPRPELKDLQLEDQPLSATGEAGAPAGELTPEMQQRIDRVLQDPGVIKTIAALLQKYNEVKDLAQMIAGNIIIPMARANHLEAEIVMAVTDFGNVLSMVGEEVVKMPAYTELLQAYLSGISDPAALSKRGKEFAVWADAVLAEVVSKLLGVNPVLTPEKLDGLKKQILAVIAQKLAEARATQTSGVGIELKPVVVATAQATPESAAVTTPAVPEQRETHEPKRIKLNDWVEIEGWKFFTGQTIELANGRQATVRDIDKGMGMILLLDERGKEKAVLADDFATELASNINVKVKALSMEELKERYDDLLAEARTNLAAEFGGHDKGAGKARYNYEGARSDYIVMLRQCFEALQRHPDFVGRDKSALEMFFKDEHKKLSDQLAAQGDEKKTKEVDSIFRDVRCDFARQAEFVEKKERQARLEQIGSDLLRVRMQMVRAYDDGSNEAKHMAYEVYTDDYFSTLRKYFEEAMGELPGNDLLDKAKRLIKVESAILRRVLNSSESARLEERMQAVLGIGASGKAGAGAPRESRPRQVINISEAAGRVSQGQRPEAPTAVVQPVAGTRGAEPSRGGGGGGGPRVEQARATETRAAFSLSDFQYNREKLNRDDSFLSVNPDGSRTLWKVIGFKQGKLVFEVRVEDLNKPGRGFFGASEPMILNLSEWENLAKSAERGLKRVVGGEVQGEESRSQQAGASEETKAEEPTKKFTFAGQEFTKGEKKDLFFRDLSISGVVYNGPYVAKIEKEVNGRIFIVVENKRTGLEDTLDMTEEEWVDSVQDDTGRKGSGVTARKKRGILDRILGRKGPVVAETDRLVDAKKQVQEAKKETRDAVAEERGKKAA